MGFAQCCSAFCITIFQKGVYAQGSPLLVPLPHKIYYSFVPRVDSERCPRILCYVLRVNSWIASRRKHQGCAMLFPTQEYW